MCLKFENKVLEWIWHLFEISLICENYVIITFCNNSAATRSHTYLIMCCFADWFQWNLPLFKPMLFSSALPVLLVDEVRVVYVYLIWKCLSTPKNQYQNRLLRLWIEIVLAFWGLLNVFLLIRKLSEWSVTNRTKTTEINQTTLDQYIVDWYYQFALLWIVLPSS